MSSSIPLLPMLRSDKFFPDDTFDKIEKDDHDTFDKIEEDDPIWKDYVVAAQDYDKKMIEEWNKFLDVILVFIALFIAVLTAFIIETAKQFDRDPAKITNDLLVNISKQISDSSQPVAQIPLLEPGDLHKAIVSNALLFVSLALSIATAMVAMAAKLWLIEYIRWVREAGSSYRLAMRRQKAFGGMRAWKLHRTIDSLPIWVLIAVSLFGAFIHQSIRDHDSNLGYIVGLILLIGLTFLVIASCSAAFISSSPFHSPFSHFISWFFYDILCKHLTRNVSLGITALISCGAAISTIFLVPLKDSTYQLLIFVPIVGIFAVAPKREEFSEDSKEDSKEVSLWYGPPQLAVMGGFTVFIPIAVASYFADRSKVVYMSVSSGSIVLLALYCFGIYKVTRKARRVNTLEAEAIAWLLESTQDPEPLLFKKACSVATTTPRKARLLSPTPSLFPHMIAFRFRHTSDEHKDPELRTLLSCLLCLSEFPDVDGSFVRNTATFKHPKLPPVLFKQLKELKSNADPDVRNAAVDILHDFRRGAEPEQIMESV